MKAYLMNEQSSFSPTPMFHGDITLRDVELQEVIAYMANKDPLISDICTKALKSPLTSLEEIHYRQDILKDSLSNSETIQNLYTICSGTLNQVNKYFFGMKSSSPRNVFLTSIDYLRIYLDGLKELRTIADKESSHFSSKGIQMLFDLLKAEFSDDYLEKAYTLLSELKNSDGILIQAKYGSFLENTDYVLCRIHRKFNSLKFITTPTLKLKEGDEEGKKDLENRQNRALHTASMALSDSAEHIGSFFQMLQSELAFYVGALNLKDFLEKQHMPYCIPELKEGFGNRTWENLYDVALVTKKKAGVTENSNISENKMLHIITGANQGGKTTFLRSFGQAQIMAQAGMIVGAEAFVAPIHKGIYTHFKKEEDKKIKSGKLDEELSRMSEIVDHIEPNSLLLFNESFTSTNEREGSEINQMITDALLNHDHEIFTVTHLYTFSHSYIENEKAEFFMAEREESGKRTHKLLKKTPETTAYGEDLYRKVFEE